MTAGLCGAVFGQDQGGSTPTAMSILRRYEAAVRLPQTFHLSGRVHYRTSLESSGRQSTEPALDVDISINITVDKDRADIRINSSPTSGTADGMPSGTEYDQFVIADGELRQCTSVSGKPPGWISIDPADSKNITNIVMGWVGPLHGYVEEFAPGSFESWLENATDLRLLPATEDVGGKACYVIAGKTNHGNISAWFSCSDSCSLTKLAISKESVDLFGTTPLASPDQADNPKLLISENAQLTDLHYEQVGEYLLPTSGSWIRRFGRQNGDHQLSVSQWSDIKVTLDPNLTSPGLFALDAPNGVPVYDSSARQIRKVWMDGKSVAVVDKEAEQRIGATVQNLSNGVAQNENAPVTASGTLYFLGGIGILLAAATGLSLLLLWHKRRGHNS
jgi:hypothetical protein